MQEDPLHVEGHILAVLYCKGAHPAGTSVDQDLLALARLAVSLPSPEDRSQSLYHGEPDQWQSCCFFWRDFRWHMRDDCVIRNHVLLESAPTLALQRQHTVHSVSRSESKNTRSDLLDFPGKVEARNGRQRPHVLQCRVSSLLKVHGIQTAGSHLDKNLCRFTAHRSWDLGQLNHCCWPRLCKLCRTHGLARILQRRLVSGAELVSNQFQNAMQCFSTLLLNPEANIRINAMRKHHKATPAPKNRNVYIYVHTHTDTGHVWPLSTAQVH